jgi:putative flippase GtrA
MTAKGKMIGWVVILGMVLGCYLFYQFVNPTPVGLMPLVGCGVALVVGFLMALGKRGEEATR